MESAKNAGEIICEVRSLLEVTVPGFSLMLLRAVEYHSDFVRFLWVINDVMPDIRDGLAICSCHLMFWYLLCLTAVYDLVHEFHVVLAIRFTGFKTFLERLESVPGHCTVVR